jgi:hypothetical protein
MRSHPSLRAGSILVGLGLLYAPRVVRGETDVFGTGDGHLGALVISAKDSVVNVYAPVAEKVAAGATAVKIGAAAPAGGSFQAHDLILLWQAAGLAPAPSSGNRSSIDLGASTVGRWELARVLQVESGGAALRLTRPVVDPAGFAASVSQVVRVPEYTTVSIGNNASLRALPWDGARGGIVAFLAQGAVTLDAAGTITADGAGFRGGVLQDAAVAVYGCTALDGAALTGYAAKGEGVATAAYSAAQPVLRGGRGNVANGGGGGDCRKAGGGGGGNGGTGGKGGYSWPGALDLGGSRDVGGLGGVSLRYSLLSRLSLGGGGGAGEEDSSLGSGGASGGGAIFVRAGSLGGSGRITAAGASGAAATPGLLESDGAGGGGAGGSILLRFQAGASCREVSAAGGRGGDGGGDCGSGHLGVLDCQSDGPGGGGAGGRILLQAKSKTCAADVKAGLAGSQASAIWPGGAHRGAGPTDEGDSTAVGVVEEPPGAYCASNADCSGSQAICEAGSCRPCVSSDCSGAAPVCDRTTGSHQGQCVECTAASKSACTGTKPLCDTATDTCVGCISALDCSGATPICDSKTRLCRPCAEVDCTPTGSVCITDSNDAMKGRCVQCAADRDCATQACSFATHTCTNCGSSAQCSKPKPVCGSGGACEGCTSDGECALWPSAPLCGRSDPLKGYCVQCTPTDLAHCGPGTPSCNPDTGACVDCAKDADCHDPRKPLCDLDRMACAPCAADRGANAPLACPSATAPACQRNGDIAGECAECSPTENSLCTGDKPRCLADFGVCGCASDLDCGASGPGRSCRAGVCVGGADGGADDASYDARADAGPSSGPDAGPPEGGTGFGPAGVDGGGSPEIREAAVSIQGGGLACSAAGSPWTAAGLALTILSFAGVRRSLRRG